MNHVPDPEALAELEEDKMRQKKKKDDSANDASNEYDGRIEPLPQTQNVIRVAKKTVIPAFSQVVVKVESNVNASMWNRSRRSSRESLSAQRLG